MVENPSPALSEIQAECLWVGRVFFPEFLRMQGFSAVLGELPPDLYRGTFLLIYQGTLSSNSYRTPKVCSPPWRGRAVPTASACAGIVDGNVKAVLSSDKTVFCMQGADYQLRFKYSFTAVSRSAFISEKGTSKPGRIRSGSSITSSK